MRERTGRNVQVAGNKIKTASKIAAQECLSLRLAGACQQQQKRRGVWPPRVQDVQRGDQMAYGETQQDVDVRLSADDIRDRLKTLKSRGGNRHMRAVSANGVLENEQINDIDVDDPRSIVRSETVSPTSHQQSKFLGDDRPISRCGTVVMQRPGIMMRDLNPPLHQLQQILKWLKTTGWRKMHMHTIRKINV